MTDDAVPTTDRPSTVLVTGATGYVGSRLVPRLLDAGHHVLAATRDASALDDYPWGERVEARELDVEDEALVASAVEGADAVVYLVHSLEADDVVAKDRAAAERMAAACERAGVERVVYLSGLVPDGELSEHLASRRVVERVLLDSSVPATVLAAAMVIGSGSTSFELLRRLSDRLRVTPVPSWMTSRVQPVAVDDVVALVAGALTGEPRNRHYDIGGDDVLAYPDLLALYAEVAGLRRRRFTVPGAPRWLVGRVCARLSGLPRATVVSLVESLSLDLVCDEQDARHDLLPAGYRMTPLREALERALAPEGGGTTSAGDPLAGAATDPA